MTEPITWTDCKVRLSDLTDWEGNPAEITKEAGARLVDSFNEFGQIQTLAIDPDGKLVDGHQRKGVWIAKFGGDFVVDCRRASRRLTEKERQKIAVLLRSGTTGRYNWDKLSAWNYSDLSDWGMDASTLQGWKTDVAALGNLIESEKPAPGDAEPQTDRAEELKAKWQTEAGQLWQIGDHRLLIADCTIRENVEKVMNGRRAILCHADPPYGMGKENEGIENDNLYREKLDTFQMQWWKACRPFLLDNASVYIWGQAEDLWRLWYRGLKDSERLTFRNEITWNKGQAQGIRTAGYNMYPMATERCLFFVIGEMGFNNNSDNYFEGWEPIRSYLAAEMEKVCEKKEWDKVLGNYMGKHYFTKSQWLLPTEKEYKKMQALKPNDAFKREYDEIKREYDEIKREWYATRAPFDNTHDSMTDVWEYLTLQGDERPDHPTPKPPAMIERIIKTSGTDDAPTYAPFLGTAPEMIAAQNCGRIVYGCETSETFAAVILERMSTAFPTLKIEKIENGTPD